MSDAINYITQLGSKPASDAREFDFRPQSPGGSLTGGVGATVTLSPVPKGVNGTDTSHRLYISGGAGTAEAVLITGGTAISEAASGTITFTPANSHSGSWTIASATGGIQEALVTINTTSGMVPFLWLADLTTLHAPIYVYAGMQGIFGARGVLLTAASDFLGASMMIGLTNLAAFHLRDVAFDAQNLAGITTVLDFHQAENSIRDQFQGVIVLNIPTNAIGLNLDGCEDSTVLDCQFLTSNAGVKAISWHVPGGGGFIAGITTFRPIYLSYQNFTIISSTTGGIVADGTAQALTINGSYNYADPATGRMFNTTGGNVFGSLTLIGSYEVAIANNNVVFGGAWVHVANIKSSYLNAASFTGVTAFSAATTTTSQALFVFDDTNPFLGGMTLGSPGAGVGILNLPGVLGLQGNAPGPWQAQSHSTSSIAATNVFSGLAGTYRIDYTLAQGSVAGTGTVQVEFVWNDADGVRTPAGAALALSSGAVQSGSFLAIAATGTIQYQTTYSAGSGGNYDLWITITKLS